MLADAQAIPAAAVQITRQIRDDEATLGAKQSNSVAQRLVTERGLNGTTTMVPSKKRGGFRT